MKQLYYLLIIVILGYGCQKRQDVYIDLALAEAALMAAKEAKSDIYAPFYYRKAETFYLTAKKDYTNKFFSSSKGNSNKSREYSEIAEKKSILKIQRGDEGDNSIEQDSTNGISTNVTPQSTISSDDTLDEDPF